MTLEEIKELLNRHGVETEYTDIDNHGFSRRIAFKVYDIDYKIVWFCNQSTLEIGHGKRPACIPFKYVYFDNTYPLINGNKSIGFSYSKKEKTSRFDRVYPYEVFRIPLEI